MGSGRAPTRLSVTNITYYLPTRGFSLPGILYLGNCGIFFSQIIYCKKKPIFLYCLFIRCIYRWAVRRVWTITFCPMLELIISPCNLDSPLTAATWLPCPICTGEHQQVNASCSISIQVSVIALLCQQHCSRCFKNSISRSRPVRPFWFYMQPHITWYIYTTNGLSCFRGKNVNQ